MEHQTPEESETGHMRDYGPGVRVSKLWAEIFGRCLLIEGRDYQERRFRNCSHCPGS